MPTKPKAKPRALRFFTWGWSRYHDYCKCPAYAMYKHLQKLPEPESQALEYGHQVHELAQKYAVGSLKKLPKDLANFKEEFTWLQAHKRQVMVEQQHAVDSRWQRTEWWESDAKKQRLPMPWLRAVLDAAVPEIRKPLPWEPKLTKAVLEKTVVVIDHKTGKVRDENQPQLELYAITAFAHFPEAQRVDAQFWYLNQGELKRTVVERAQLPALQKTWAKRVAPLLGDQQFRPTPGKHCTWCVYRKSNNGPCKF